MIPRLMEKVVLEELAALRKFSKTYQTPVNLVNKDNYLDFVLGE